MQGDKFHHYLNDTEPKVVEFEKEMLYVLRTNFIIVTTLHKKWSFLLRISSVKVTKSADSCGFGHIYLKNL